MSMSFTDRSALVYLLWIMAITFILGYPIGRYAVPGQPWQAQWAFGAFLISMSTYAAFMLLIAPSLQRRRWKKWQEMHPQKEGQYAARK